MNDIKVFRADSLHIVVTNIVIRFEDESVYELNAKDSVFFTVKDRYSNVVMEKKFPGSAELVNGNFLATLSPEDTDSLPCVCYDYDCKIDIGSKGRDVYTLVKGTFTVIETATDMEVMRGYG